MPRWPVLRYRLWGLAHILHDAFFWSETYGEAVHGILYPFRVGSIKCTSNFRLAKKTKTVNGDGWWKNKHKKHLNLCFRLCIIDISRVS